MTQPAKRTSLERYRLKRTLERLEKKEGRGTELISLYVPPGRQISEVVSTLRQEHGTAANIKSDTTRNNVQDAIVRTMQRLKLFKEVPETGLVIFCGAIPQNGPGSERLETYVLIPPDPIRIYLYRCDAKFHLEYLQEMLREKETYGILVIDSSDAIFATLQGRRLETQKEISSGVPGKHRAGGQSARRFERVREQRLLDYYRRVGEYANEIFLNIPDLKGLIIAGPGPTKYDFEKTGFLHYTLKDKIIDTLDVAYVGEQGLKEVIEHAPEIMRRVRYVEEKQIVQAFLYEVGHDTGLATYGEEDVRKALQAGAAKTLLLSEALDSARVTVKCGNCDYMQQVTVKLAEQTSYEQNVVGKQCPKCNSSSLTVADTKDIVDDLAELAEQVNAEVELISIQTEEGQMLRKSFGGIAAILRFKYQN